MPDRFSSPGLGRSGSFVPYAVAGAGIVASVLLFAWSVRVNAAEQSLRLRQHVDSFVEALGNRVQSYIDTLPGLRVAAQSSVRPSDAEFKRYVESISLEQRYPGLALTFIADRVGDSERDRYVETVRKDTSLEAAGHPGFAITPGGRRDEYMIVRHLYPTDPVSFGYDLYDPTKKYRKAVQAAIDSGAYVATAPILLAHDRDRPVERGLISVVVRSAFYAGGATPRSVEERRTLAMGVVGVAFRTDEIVRAVMPASLPDGVRVRITDLSDLVYDSQPDAPPPAVQDRAGRALERSVRVADRTWQVEAVPRAASPLQSADWSSWTVLLLGLAASLSMGALTRALARTAEVANARVRERTEDLEQEKQQLSISEQRYRMLFENNFDAVLRTTADGTIVAANPAAGQLLRAEPQALAGWPRERYVDPGDPRVVAFLATRAATGRGQGFVTMRRADGSTFEAEVSSNRFTDVDGSTVNSLIVRDMSERRRAEEERRQLERQLQQSQKLEAVGTLAGGIAHDFNNILAIVLGNTAMLAQDLGPGHPDAATLDVIRKAALRARTLTQQLLAFSRPQADEFRAQDMRTAINEAVALLRSTLPTMVALDLSLPPQPVCVVMNATQMQQVLINLCSNAWQAMPDRKGRISIALDVQQADGQARGQARLRVSDDGAGMDEATLARAFEPFFTTKPVGQGTGLGLAVVHGIVGAHGGTIAASSTVGRGSSFEIRLPVADEDATEEAGSEFGELSAFDSPRRRVLYIDDDEVVSLTVVALLERQGFHVTPHSSAQAALEALRADPWDVDALVTDYNMPHMTGLDLAREALSLRADLPVIIISGHVTEELQSAADAAGVRRVLLKQFVVERLAPTLAGVLGATPAA